MTKIAVIIPCFILTVFSNPLGGSEDLNSLELVHVIFRHGDRTPEGPYPNDPYFNETYYPVGLGQLTNPGKRTAYNLGVALRERYGKFLGDIYTPDLIDPISSPYPRCKASAALVLAGLFPPTETQLWNEDLPWQPIPYSYSPQDQDKLFWSFTNCPNVYQFLGQYLASPEANYHLIGYEDVISYLLANSGYTSSFQLGLQLHSTLKSQQEWGLALPSWTDSVWPDPISTLAALDWETFVGTDQLRILAGGYVMSKIKSDTYSKINNTDAFKSRKLIFYSGHDLSIVSILGWLQVFVPHSPPYGAYITFEIHNISGTRVIKIFYQHYSTPSPQHVKIPLCEDICTLDRFVELYERFFVVDAICG